MKRGARVVISILSALLLLLFAFGAWVKWSYRRPYRATVEAVGPESALVYAVMKAESGFDETAVSAAGAVGLMQLLPSTAEFVCRMSGEPFQAERLKEGEYNILLGCRYLKYLLGKFGPLRTALAAYNAGEGVVAQWLTDASLSEDGKTLNLIPYPETARYVKKIEKFRKNYLIFYH